jgi:outer membrane protein assembly factor BamB
MQFRNSLVGCVASAVLAASSLVASAADWAQFRGPGGRAQASVTGLPTTWSDSENIRWKTALPGPGASSPVTWNGKIFLTCYSGYGLDQREPGDAAKLQRHLLCLDRDGKILWNRAVKLSTPELPYQGFTALHGYASSTPAVDAQAIYVFFGASGAAAFSHDGEPLWETGCGTGTHDWGSGTSPVLHDQLVIINASVESGSLVALDKKTGKEVWHAPGMKQSWNTPALVKTGQAWELAVQVQGQVLGFDPLTGEKLWECKGIDDYICPTILEQDGVLYAAGARQSKLVAVRPGGRGDVSDSHKLWTLDKGSNVSSPVFHEGHLYWAHESRGAVYCANAKTGELVYEKRLEKPGRIYASPIVADGKVYYVTREKGTFVVAAKPEFELLAHNVIESDTSIFNGSPIVLDGTLLLRSDKYLYCLGP